MLNKNRKIVFKNKGIDIKLILNNNLPTNEITELNYTSCDTPFIATNYFNPKPNVGEDIIIPYYITDYYHKEYLENNNSETFTVIAEFNGRITTRNVYAGNNSINIGSCDTEGETYFSLYAIDKRGVSTIKQFVDLLIVDPNTYAITEDETYIMKEEDLVLYSISNLNSKLEEDLINTRTGLTKLLQDTKSRGYRKIKLLPGIYRINYSDVSVGTPIILPSQFTLDLNGSTIKAHTCISNSGNLIQIRDTFDSHLINGSIEGNYDEFDFQATADETGYDIPGEHIMLTQLEGGRYTSIENVDMSKCVGYNLGTISSNSNTILHNSSPTFVDNVYIVNGVEKEMEGLSTTGFYDITQFLDIGYVQLNVFLGYGGYRGKVAEQFFHFYDENKIFIQTTKNRQYQLCKIPKAAKYIRITCFGSSSDLVGMRIHYLDVPTHCSFKEIHSHDTRTVAMHPGLHNHFLIEGCTFDNVAKESGKWQVTKLIIDIEDGYQNGKNVYFRNNDVINNVANGGLIVLHTYNLNIENCNNFDVEVRGGIIGLNYSNNKNGSLTNYYRDINVNRIHRVKDSIISGILIFKPKDGNVYTLNTNYKVKNCSVPGIQGFYTNNNKTLILESCIYDGSYPGYGVTSNNCIIQNMSQTTSLAENLFFNNCKFYDTNSNHIKIFCFKGGKLPTFTKCTFDGIVNITGGFTEGLFSHCTFSGDINISGNLQNKIGDIQINDCTIDKIKLNLLETKIQFNNCLFANTPIYQNNGEINSEFNNCQFN